MVGQHQSRDDGVDREQNNGCRDECYPVDTDKPTRQQKNHHGTEIHGSRQHESTQKKAWGLSAFSTYSEYVK